MDGLKAMEYPKINFMLKAMHYLSDPYLTDALYLPFVFQQLLRYRVETLSNLVKSSKEHLVQNFYNYKKEFCWKFFFSWL